MYLATSAEEIVNTIHCCFCVHRQCFDILG